MNEEFYRIAHLTGVFLTIMSLSGLCVFASVADKDGKKLWRRMLTALHGIGLLVVLIAGFGLMVKLKVDSPWPSFIWIKIVVWLLMGGIVVLIKRAPRLALPWWWISLALATAAAWAAKAHPGL